MTTGDTQQIERTCPEPLRAERYICGVEAVNGAAAWQLFCAARGGDLETARGLVGRDPKLVNVEYWYQQPLHFAVRAGHVDISRLLLERGAEPGQARFLYDSWEELLEAARLRRDGPTHELLERTLAERFAYHASFSKLADLVRGGSVEDLRRELDRSPELMLASDCFGNSLAHFAAILRSEELVHLYVEEGGSLDRPRADGKTPTLLLVGGDYRFRVPPVLPSTVGADLALRFVELGAPYDLSLACALGDVERARRLLEESSVAATELDSARRSPLRYAAQAGSLEIVEMLLEAGADPNRPEDLSTGGHALFTACQLQHVEIVRRLLAAGADPNGSSDSSGCCLSIAGQRGAERGEQIVALLRDAGARKPPWELDEAEMKDALMHGHPESRDPWFVSEVLARNSADLVEVLHETQPDRFARIHAGELRCGDPDAALRSLEALGRLLELGWNPLRGNWVGKTALHHFAERGLVPHLGLVLDRGVPIDPVEDVTLATPLALAARNGHTEAVRLLLGRGADPSIPREHPWASAAAQARQSGHEDLAGWIDDHSR